MLEFRRFNGKDDLDAPAQVAIHPVGRADVDLRIAVVAEIKDPAVLQEAIDDGDDADVFTQPRQLRPQGANAAANDVDFDASLTGPIKRLHHRRLDQAVDLDDDAAFIAGFLHGDFLLDLLNHEQLQTARRQDQLPPLRQLAVAGEIVEQCRHVFAKRVVASEEAKIGVNAGRLRVVITGGQVDVAADAVFLAANHQGDLAVGFKTDEAVDDVDA